jgi:hypothetical protein
MQSDRVPFFAAGAALLSTAAYLALRTKPPTVKREIEPSR